MSSNLVKKFYQDVLEQLFEQSSALWEEEGLEDSSMSDLRQLWESKLLESGIEVSREGAGQDPHESAPSKASGRSAAKSKNNQNGNAASTQSGRKARSSPQAEPQLIQASSLAQHQHPQLAPIQYQPSEQQQQHVRQQNASLQSQQPGRPAQVVANHGQNPSVVPIISLLPYSVPMSGPLVHISSSSSQVPNTNVMPGLVQRQQLQHSQPGNAPTMVVGPNGIQQLLLGSPGNQLRSGNMSQIISQQQQQQNQRQSMMPAEDRSQLLEHFRLQMLRSQQQNSLMVNRLPPTQQDIPQKFRQQNGVIAGNQQFVQVQNHNANGLYAMGSQFPFQQSGGGSGQSSVIHVADSSGNQSALQLSVMHSGNDSVNNMGTPTGRGGNIRKPGQSLPLQLDGGDDDDDDDDAFQDLSDDEAPVKSTPRPAKKQKTGDRRDLSERLEEEDLDSEDDDDNDDNTASVVDAIDNVVVCQYEKISRTRNKWKLHLKSGMCSLNGKEYIFHKAAGDAEF